VVDEADLYLTGSDLRRPGIRHRGTLYIGQRNWQLTDLIGWPDGGIIPQQLAERQYSTTVENTLRDIRERLGIVKSPDTEDRIFYIRRRRIPCRVDHIRRTNGSLWSLGTRRTSCSGRTSIPFLA